MISFLSNWIQKIAIGVIIASIFELILPNGNLKKYIKVVLGIYIVFCIISPFINNSLFQDLDEIDLEKYIENTSDASKQNLTKPNNNLNMEELYIDELKNNIKKQVESYGYKTVQCNITADLDSSSQNPGIHKIDLIVEENEKNISSIDKIEINLNISNEKEIIIDDQNNPNLMKLKESLANYYEINKNIISIQMR